MLLAVHFPCFRYLLGDMLTGEKFASVPETRLCKTYQSQLRECNGFTWRPYSNVTYSLLKRFICFFSGWREGLLQFQNNLSQSLLKLAGQMIVFEKKDMVINDRLRPTRQVCRQVRFDEGHSEVWRWWGRTKPRFILFKNSQAQDRCHCRAKHCCPEEYHWHWWYLATSNTEQNSQLWRSSLWKRPPEQTPGNTCRLGALSLPVGKPPVVLFHIGSVWKVLMRC